MLEPTCTHHSCQQQADGRRYKWTFEFSDGTSVEYDFNELPLKGIAGGCIGKTKPEIAVQAVPLVEYYSTDRSVEARAFCEAVNSGSYEQYRQKENENV